MKKRHLLNLPLKHALFVLLTATLVSPFVHADPITRQEADAWINRVRAIEQIPSDLDLKTEYQSRLQIIEADLEKHPDSLSDKRDLGDIYHVLGHLAEYDHDYVAALSYHFKSLRYYLSSNGLKASGSWGDGTEHAREHIFICYYDQGVFLERQGKSDEAEKSFELAWKTNVEFDNIFEFKLRIRTSLRYDALLKRRRRLGQPLDIGDTVLTEKARSCDEMLSKRLQAKMARLGWAP